MGVRLSGEVPRAESREMGAGDYVCSMVRKDLPAEIVFCGGRMAKGGEGRARVHT